MSMEKMPTAYLRQFSMIAGCRAFKIITGPFWRKLEGSAMSVLKMASTLL